MIYVLRYDYSLCICLCRPIKIFHNFLNSSWPFYLIVMTIMSLMQLTNLNFFEGLLDILWISISLSWSVLVMMCYCGKKQPYFHPDYLASYFVSRKRIKLLKDWVFISLKLFFSWLHFSRGKFLTKQYYFWQICMA